VTRVEIIPQTAQGINAMQGQDVFVRVTASDDSSGVSKVQVSHSAGLISFSEFAVTGSMTNIPWTLQFSGAVYVRVVDRAGNLSPVSSGPGPAHNRICLPLVVKSRP